MTIIHEPIPAYLARDEMRPGDLEAAFHGPESWLDHKARGDKGTKYTGFGTMVHSLVENTGALGDGYYYEPTLLGRVTKQGKPASNPRSTSEYKAEVALLKAANPGAQMISKEDEDRAMACYRALRAHPRARQLLFDNRVEAEPTITFSKSGVPLACRYDVLASEGGGIADAELKVARDISPFAFRNAIRDRGYIHRPFFRTEGIRQEFGVEYAPFYWIVVETQPTDRGRHRVAVYPCGEDAMGKSAEAFWKGLVNVRSYLDAPPPDDAQDNPGESELPPLYDPGGYGTGEDKDEGGRQFRPLIRSDQK